jgi:asparagine synthase (glutamine-hydrolysing)
VPVFALSRELRKKVTVAISGDGGDELFCGYGRYLAFASARQSAPSQTACGQLEAYFDSVLPVFGTAAVSAAFPGEHSRWRGDFLDRHAVLMLRSGWNDAQRLSTLDFLTYLPGAVLSKVDRMSMRHALEVRSPFFAPAVMKLAANLAPGMCANGATLKPVLRALLSRYLGPETVGAPKSGFGMPAGFIQSHAAVFNRLLGQAREALAATAFFGARTGALRTLAEAAPRNINSLWAFVVLGLWVGATGLRL